MRCDAEQAAQEWWVQFLGLPATRFRPDAPAFPYAYVMLTRICQTMARRARIRTTKALPPDVASAVGSPWRRAARREDKRRVQAAIETLDVRDQALVKDKFWDERPADEIAKRQGISIATVGRRMRRVLDQVRAAL